MASGLVYIVGAGPGDPGLVTLRAREVLAGAESVIYDNLIHPDLLDWAPEGAERVWMGKVGHGHQHAQEEITAALIERARQGRVVVRLKGGDPSIFGRLGEEAEALAAAGVPFEIVPGVTAASGAAAYAGIPLTHRDCAPSVTFVTGHRRKDGGKGPDIDWEALARGSGTLVLYMGVKHLGEIAPKLVAAGRDPSTPVAVVRRATWPDQQVVEGTLADIAERVAAEGLEPPALTIVGGVTRLRAQLSWFEGRPLRGRRLLVTRAGHQAGDFSTLLRRRGALPLELSLIELRPCGHKSGVEASLKKLFAYDWVVFSSVNAVEFTFRRLGEMGLDARCFGAARVCAVGPKTAELLVTKGIRADVVPAQYVAEALVEALKAEGELRGASVLIPRAKDAREVVPEELQKLGARVEVLPIYENVRPETYPAAALDALRRGELDAVTLASSSAAKSYAALCQEHGIDPKRVACAVIGPATKTTAEDLGLPVAVMPAEYTLEGMVGALEEYFAGGQRSALSRRLEPKTTPVEADS
ncbi:MAG: uroporphyrinogen-III C-methyltransferase [Deltaproteobacteria bacterium]|nr:uroporphyrinogen-III C-methyltransferase [Deltaproteobacteria bacterium]